MENFCIHEGKTKTGSVYELMKDATGFSDNDIYLLAKVIRMYGHRNVDILKQVNLRLYEKIRDFNHRKYDILSSKSQDFINKMFEGAVGEYDRRPSYYTWPRLQTDFRALDSRYCIELITTFPALSRLDGIRNALRSPKGNKADDSSVPTRKVTMALMKASQSFVGALAKCHPDLFKFKEQIEKFVEDVRKKALTYKDGREDVACVLSSVYHAFA
ncbi:hypothetical protein NECAME_04571 [Necator americanus]|uniref:Uncharacterized protein n=1 Tax=Necator americanus TaxID=51031 RepID=W2ST19_NECAM|nr:hypothetical protein NECAME_04571 [Necator americanus]ETN71827.1 hypothetical protein NECAME_04571 [Necator americanus]